jgi:selenocysteine lyase/cysteine desulfurase
MLFDTAKIRARFPALNQPINGDTWPVFFDNPAGTQVPQPVIDAVADYYRNMNANSGGDFATSRRSAVVGPRANEQPILNAARPRIVFGPNMTTLSFALSRAIGKTLSPGDEIVLTRMDHDANVMPWLRLAEDYHLTVRWVDIRTDDCTLDMNSLEAALTNRTKVVATDHASNAVGTINPVKQIAGTRAGRLCGDAVRRAACSMIRHHDFLLCSAHKFRASASCGAAMTCWLNSRPTKSALRRIAHPIVGKRARRALRRLMALAQPLITWHGLASSSARVSFQAAQDGGDICCWVWRQSNPMSRNFAAISSQGYSRCPA